MKLDMFEIITPQFTAMKNFYKDVIGMEPSLEKENYAEFRQGGGVAIRKPSDMPWGHRSAFTTDLDGNTIQIFSDPN